MKQLVIKITPAQLKSVDAEIKQAETSVAGAMSLKSFDSAVCGPYLIAKPVLTFMSGIVPGYWKAAIKGLIAFLDAECNKSVAG